MSNKRNVGGGESPLLNKSDCSFDEVMDEIGTGKYQWFVLFLCGWANASDAVEMLAISFVLPAATEDLQMTDPEKGLLSAIIFVGLLIGGWVWGGVSDKYGRKTALTFSLFLNFLFGFLSSFSPNYALLLVLRFLSGIGVGGSIPVVFSYFCEFLPTHSRGKFLVLLAWFWMIGSIIASGLGWAIVPNTNISFNIGFPYDSWRVFVAASSLPALISSISMMLAPESPRWYYSKGKTEEATKILKRMFFINKGTPPITSIISPLIGYERPDLTIPNITRPDYENDTGTTEKWYTYITSLFGAKLRRPTICLIVIWFTLSFGYYGLTLWMPEYFRRSNIVFPSGFNAYVTVFVSSLCNLPGNIISVFAVDTIGRRMTLGFSMVISGLSVFFIFFINNGVSLVIMSCVFAGLSIPAWNALDILSAELFPTTVRASGMGLIMVVGRLGAIFGNLTFGEFIAVDPAIPLCLSAGCLFVGGVTAYFLPRSENKNLED